MRADGLAVTHTACQVFTQACAAAGEPNLRSVQLLAANSVTMPVLQCCSHLPPMHVGGVGPRPDTMLGPFLKSPTQQHG